MNIGTLQEVIDDMQRGVFDFTDNGKCSCCGQCCSNFLPVSSKEIKTIRTYIRKHGIKEQKHNVPTANPIEDWTCPFRNNVEKKCVIYPVRPAICRDFQCDKPKKSIYANRDMYHGKYGVVLMRELFFGGGA